MLLSTAPQRQAAAPLVEAVVKAQTPMLGLSGGAAARSGTKGTLCSAAAAAPTVLHCYHMSSVMHVDSASLPPPKLAATEFRAVELLKNFTR